MRRIIATGVLALVVIGQSCNDDPNAPQIGGLPRDLQTGEQQLIESDNSFGLKLFREIHGQGPGGTNIFISPLSVAMALGMTYNGADGATQQAMQETLELQGMTLDEVNRSYRSLIDLLSGLDPAVQFLIANSIWYREDLPVEQDFLDVNAEFFDAEVSPLDFASPDAAPTINAWVSDKTNGLIPEIVDAPISPELVMFLINAIYFKGSWATRFDADLTGPGTFRLADGSTKQVEMMTYGTEVELSVGRVGGVTVLDLPYGGEAYSMTIALPDAGLDIDSLAASLDSETWQGWIDGLSAGETGLVMPKFRLEYEIELSAVLKALGMEVAFDPDAAEFSKIYSGPWRLYISAVKHKTYVDVNEEGTEAAAVTSVEVSITSMPPMIYVDRPFVFAIRERFSGTILFMGLIQDPS